MGREATCTVTCGQRRARGKARLESSGIQFRGWFRVNIPLSGITSLLVEGDDLKVQHEGTWTTFSLGADAAKWAERIRSPRSLMDKLGVKAGQQVVLESFPDPVLRDQLAARSARMVDRAASRAADVAFLGVSARADLRRIATLRRSLTPSGALWVLWAKGRQELTEGHVRDAARAAGLVDVKVVALSATHSALKLVVPRASRRGSIR